MFIKNPRTRLSLFNGLVATLSRVSQFLSAIIAIPLILTYQTNSDLDIYLICAGLIGLSSLADLGIGLGIINVVSALDAENDKLIIGKIAKNSFRILAVWATILLIFGVIIIYSVDWSLFLRIPYNSKINLKNILSIFFVLFCGLIPISVGGRILFSMQKGYISSINDSIGQATGLILIVMLTVIYHADLAQLVAILFAPLYISNILSWRYLKRSNYLISESVQVSVPIPVLKNSEKIRFILIQVLVICTFSLDNILLTSSIGSERASNYAVMLKLLGIILATHSTITGPLWPSINSAMNSKDSLWINKIWNNGMKLSIIVGGILALLIGFFGPNIVNFWTSGKLHPSIYLCCGFAIWLAILIPSALVALFVNASQGSIPIIVLSILGIALTLTIKLYCSRVYGDLGLIYGSAIIYLLTFTLPYYYIAKRRIERLP